MLNILGIDPGLTTGICEMFYDEEKGKVEFVVLHAIPTMIRFESLEFPLHIRLAMLKGSLLDWFDDISEFKAASEIDIIAMEENFMPRGTSTAGPKACGVVEAFAGVMVMRARLEGKKIKFLSFPPATIKKELMGKGNAKRKDFTKFIWEDFLNDFIDRDKEVKKYLQHKVDAFAVALTALKKETKKEEK